jgi:hypothetical protein
MNEKINNSQKKAIQYWFIDGLAELAAGLVAILLAVLFWVWQDMFTWRWSLPFIFVVALIVSFGLRLIVQRIKVRTTYLQTGYVSPFSGFESKWSVVLLIIISLLLVGLNYYLSIKGAQSLMWSPGMAGLIFSVIFVWVATSTKLKRFFNLALISLGVGLILVLNEVGYLQGVSILTGIVGLVLLTQGYLIRNKYLHQSSMMDKTIHD